MLALPWWEHQQMRATSSYLRGPHMKCHGEGCLLVAFVGVSRCTTNCDHKESMASVRRRERSLAFQLRLRCQHTGAFSVPEQGNGELVRGGRPCSLVASVGRTPRRGRHRRGCRGWIAQVEAGQEEEEEEGQNDENLGHPCCGERRWLRQWLHG
ncbi:unnamed protein product [Musa acuminata subsp. burmannicoides]